MDSLELHFRNNELESERDNIELNNLQCKYDNYDADKKKKIIFEEWEFTRLLYLRMKSRHTQETEKNIDIDILKSRPYLDIVSKTGKNSTIYSPYE